MNERHLCSACIVAAAAFFVAGCEAPPILSADGKMEANLNKYGLGAGPVGKIRHLSDIEYSEAAWSPNDRLLVVGNDKDSRVFSFETYA